MTSPSDPIIVTDTDDLQRKFQAAIFDSVLGINLMSSDRLAVKLVEVLRANCATPATENEQTDETPTDEPATLPYIYFVAYRFNQGHGNCEVGSESPIDSFAGVDGLRLAVANGNNRIPMRADEIVILNFILLSGPKET